MLKQKGKLSQISGNRRMTDQVRRSLNHPIIGYVKSPPGITSLFVLLLVCGAATWKITADNEKDFLDIDSSNQAITKSTSKNQDKLALSSETKDSNIRKAHRRRSRLIDMAMDRLQQMDTLVKGTTDKNFSIIHLDDSSSINISPYLKAQMSTEYSKQTITDLSSEWKKRQDHFGKDHPFTIQCAIELALTQESMNEDGTPVAREAATEWLNFVKKLGEYGNSLDKSGKSTKDTGKWQFATLCSTLYPYGSVGLRRLCQWSHNSGELLAMLLWAHQQNAVALQIIKTIPIIDKVTEFDFKESAVRIHRLLTLSRLCASQNEYGEAKKLVAMAKRLANKQMSAGVVTQQQVSAMCLLEESRLSLAERDVNAAAELARQASNILERADKIVEVTQLKALKGDVLEQLARSLSVFNAKISDAIENQEKCLQLRQETFGKDGIFTAATSLDLARMLKRRLSLTSQDSAADSNSNDAERARQLLLDNISICKRNQHNDNEVLRADRNASLLLPQTYYELGCLSSTCGDFSQAREYFQKARDIDMSFTEPALIPYKVSDLDAVAAIDLQEKKIASAQSLVLKASKLLDNYVADVLPQLSLAEQIAFTDNIERHMNSLLSVCRDDGTLTNIYVEMMKWKGFLTEQFRLRSLIIKQTNDPSMNRLLASHQQLSSKILSSYVQSAQSGNAIDAGTHENQALKEEIERQINTQLRGKLQQSLAMNPQILQSRLATDEAVVDLYEFAGSPWNKQAHYGAVVSTKAALRWLDLGLSKDINAAVNMWRSYGGIRTDLPASDHPKAEEFSTSEQDAWRKLRLSFYEPVSKLVPSTITRLWISDESELTRLPWSVVMTGYPGQRTFEVCQIDSPRELITLKQQEASKKSRKDILIVGGIDYSKHNPPAPPLKHALKEVQEIKKEVQSTPMNCVVQSDYLETSQPTRKNIMNALSKCQIAHLVTHGFYNDSDSTAGTSDRSAHLADTRECSTADFQMPTRNPLIESGLLVSRPNKGAELDTGFLTAEDILDADLEGCKLITLSACETGRGREVSSQGVLGLRSALMGAGSRSVLLSLWPVPDGPTSELMKVFYQRLLSGNSAVAALKDAQAAVRKNPKWNAPYYWAAWILVGDGWEKLSPKS